MTEGSRYPSTEQRIVEIFAQRRDSLPSWAFELLSPWVRLRTWDDGVTIPNNYDLTPCAFCGHGTQGTAHRCNGLMPRPHLCDWRIANIQRISGGVSPKPGKYAVGLECYKDHHHQRGIVLDSLPFYFGEVPDA